MNIVSRILAVSALLVFHAGAADSSTNNTSSDSGQSSSSMNALSQVAGSLIEGVEKVQKDAHKKGSDLMKRTEALLDQQEAQQKRFDKILDTWERQQAQYQKYLDSLDKK